MGLSHVAHYVNSDAVGAHALAGRGGTCGPRLPRSFSDWARANLSRAYLPFVLNPGKLDRDDDVRLFRFGERHTRQVLPDVAAWKGRTRTMERGRAAASVEVYPVESMRIGIDLRLHAYAPGGISRYARRLAQALIEVIPPEQLTLIAHRKEQNPLTLPGVRAKAVWTPPHHPLEKWSLGAELLTARLDILHSTDFIPPIWGARRLVVTVHDLNFLHYPDYLTAEARRFYNRQISWAVMRADGILVDSYATQQDLVDLLHVSPKRVSVVHLAADERFRPVPDAKVTPVLERYELGRGYLLFVGVWEPRKNLPGLLDALAMLRGDGVCPMLVIACCRSRAWIWSPVCALSRPPGWMSWWRCITVLRCW